MGSLNLVCPMCCGESFNNPQSLKYHLLSMTDNLYCPACSLRSDSVMALIQHLDRCGQGLNPEKQISKDMKHPPLELDHSTELLMTPNMKQPNKSFLATVRDDGIMIVGGPQTIQMNDNGDIKVIEKMDIEDSQSGHNLLVEEISNIVTHEKPRSPSNSDNLMSLSSMDLKEKGQDKNLSILPNDADILNDHDESSIMNIDQIRDVDDDFDGSALLPVKKEITGPEREALYSCSSCGMSFNSVLEHIRQYHDGQEVVLEMAEQQFDDLNVPSSTPTTDEANSASNQGRQRQTMNTLRTEECVDNEGRVYTRKVVQIERFWDRTPTTLPSSKSPMIEKFFSNAEGLKIREKKLAATPLRMYRCTQCKQQFSKLGNFRVHACLNGSNRCDKCDQTFATLKALQLHAKVHECETDGTQKSFVCTTCGTEFCSHKSLRLHSRMHAPVRARHVDAPEGTTNDTFTCLECGKVLSESYKEAHMALHSGDSVTCTVCNRKFDSADSLAMHAAVHVELVSSNSPLLTTMPEIVDPVESQKPYQCQHCGRRFTRPHEKVKHERIHTGEKPHACEVCGKTFRVSYCLTLHMRTHTGVRPYACQHCGKRFKASSVYNHHLLTHGEERAYTCPYCPKTFKTRVQLAGHKNSHTKPFRCTECSRPFASLYAARAHIQTHKKDNNLKFSCYICGASYGRAFALKDHLKQHGQDVVPPPEPAREEEVHEGDEFLLPDREIEEDEELVTPSPQPIAQSEIDESD